MEKKLVLIGAIIITLSANGYSAHNTTDGETVTSPAYVSQLITSAGIMDPDDSKLKIDAIEELGEIGDESALPVLIESMGYGSTIIIREGNTIVTQYKVRVASALALAKVCQENPDSELAAEAVETLLWAVVNDEDSTVQRAAVQALGMIPELARTSDVLVYLHDMLDRSPENGVAYDICTTLGEIGDPASFVPLLRVTQGNFLTFVKSAAESAIEKIQWTTESVIE